jgi:signal transduction histidine kinase
VAAAATSIVLFTVVEYFVDPRSSLDVFFLLPVGATTILVSAAAGLRLTVLAAVMESLEDGANRSALAVTAVNGVGRLLILSVSVVFIAALREALAQSRLSDLRSRQFLADAAHQLRSPVTGLRSTAEALIMWGASIEQEGLMANLAAEAERVGRLIASLLEIASLDQGVPAVASPVDLIALCQTEVDLAQDLAGEAIEVKLHVPASSSLPVVIAPEALADALSNLLDNARRHATRQIAVVISYVTNETEIIVRDDGPGLPAGSEERAFERFVSLDEGRGAGLGLAIARSLIESQGGALVYRQRQFVIRIPARP